MICRPGFLAEITTGESAVIVPASPGIESTSVLDETFQLAEPVAVFNYFDSYEYLPWYFAGTEGTPEQERVIPNKELVRLCNVIDRFTLGRIEGNTASVPVQPPSGAIVERMLDGNNWLLAVETESGVETVNPTTMIWENASGQRSKVYDPVRAFDTLALEFLYATARSRQVRSVSLILKETADKSLKTIFSQSLLSSLLKTSAATLDEVTDEFGFLSTPEGVRSQYQIEAIQGLLDAYEETGSVQFKEQALLLANAVVRDFYPADDKTGLPHARLSDKPMSLPGPVRPSGEYGIVDVAVDFVQGVGFLPSEIADRVFEVFQVYEGELSQKSANSKRLFGKGYEIDSFVDKDGIVRASDRPVEPEIQEPGKVVYLLGDDVRFIFPSYSAFIMGVY